MTAKWPRGGYSGAGISGEPKAPSGAGANVTRPPDAAELAEFAKQEVMGGHSTPEEWQQNACEAIDQLQVRFDQQKRVVDALLELRAAEADLHRISHVPFTAAMAESGVPPPLPDASMLEQALYGETVYGSYHERVKRARAELEAALDHV